MKPPFDLVNTFLPAAWTRTKSKNRGHTNPSSRLSAAALLCVVLSGGQTGGSLIRENLAFAEKYPEFKPGPVCAQGIPFTLNYKKTITGAAPKAGTSARGKMACSMSPTTTACWNSTATNGGRRAFPTKPAYAPFPWKRMGWFELIYPYDRFVLKRVSIHVQRRHVFAGTYLKMSDSTVYTFYFKTILGRKSISKLKVLANIEFACFLFCLMVWFPYLYIWNIDRFTEELILNSHKVFGLFYAPN